MHKAAIILNPSKSIGLLLNTVACITSGLFVNRSDLVGEKISGKDIDFIPITKIPILILKPGISSLKDLCVKAVSKNITYMLFTSEGQSTTSYEEYKSRVRNKDINSIDIVGLGIVGDQKEINKITGNLPMFK